eukprot:g6354.t1
MYRSFHTSFILFVLLLIATTTHCQDSDSHEAEGGIHEGAGGETTHESQEQICEEEHGGADVVLVLFFMLLLGLVARYALRPVPVPYTALLLVFGLILGLMQIQLTRPNEHHGVDHQGHDRWEKFARGIDIWQRIQPELLLLVFLPALIFSSAFSLDFHITKRSFGQVLILAGPGVVIGTVLTALFVRYVFPYEWCWPKAFMFGAMISATDPVAVVALLKEVGASKRLGTVIEGESLFNDGTAFVFFLLFRDMIPVTQTCLEDKDNCLYNGAQFCEDGVFQPRGCLNDRSFGESVEFFFQLAFGGPAIGILFGLAATFWIQYIYNDLLTEISLTLVSAYLTFYVAEDVAEVSGVLAVVALGLFMGSFAKDRISSSVHGPMHVFWEMMEYLANTLIFVFTGLKVAVELFETDGEEGKWINSREWGYAVLLYLALQLIRLITIFSLLPFLSRLGYGMTWKDALVATWGGLRGAVGLALALIVELDEHNIPVSFRSYTIFYLGFVVIATLLINGTTMPYLLKLLGVTKSSPEKLEILFHLVLDMEENGKKRSNEFEDDILGNADQAEIMRLTELDVYKIIPKPSEMNKVLENASTTTNYALQRNLERLSLARVVEEPETGQVSILEQPKQQTPTPPIWTRFRNTFFREPEVATAASGGSPLMREEITQDMFDQEMRYRLLQGVKTVYAEWLEKDYIHATAMFDLIESTDAAIDDLENPISDWTHLEKIARPNRWKLELQQLKNRFCRGPIGDVVDHSISKVLFDSLSDAVLLLRTFIMAHSEAEETLHNHIINEANSEEGRVNQANMDLLEQAADKAIMESKDACDKALSVMKELRISYPEILRAIKTRLSAIEVLLEKQTFLKGIERAGLIENREANLINDMIDAKIKYLHFHSVHLDLPNAKDLLHYQPLFSHLNKQTFDAEVGAKAKPKFFQEGEKIYSMGEVPKHLIVVLRGQVKLIGETGDCATLNDGFGSVLAIAEIMLDRPMMTTVISEATTEVMMIEPNQFQQLLPKYESVRKRAWQMTGMVLTWLHPWEDLRGKTIQELSLIFRRSELIEIESQKELRIKSKAFLVVGKVSEAGFDQSRTHTIIAPAPLGPGLGVYYSLEDVKVLRMPRELASKSSSVREAEVSRKRILERSSVSLRRVSNPVPSRRTNLRHNEPMSSTLIDIPENDPQSRPSRSTGTHSRARYSMELQPSRFHNADLSMSADLEMRKEMAKEARKIRGNRMSIEF